MLSILKTLLILCVFFLHLSSSAVIRRHEEREVKHLTMSVAASTSLNALWLPSSLMGRDTTDPDDDDDPDDKSDDDSSRKASDKDDASCPLDETLTGDNPSDEDSEDDNYDNFGLLDSNEDESASSSSAAFPTPKTSHSAAPWPIKSSPVILKPASPSKGVFAKPDTDELNPSCRGFTNFSQKIFYSTTTHKLKHCGRISNAPSNPNCIPSVAPNSSPNSVWNPTAETS
jgi:hypothetical protein